MDVIILIGRILFVAIFIASGVMAHLMGAKAGIEYAEAKGVPMAKIAVPASGALIILGGLMVLLGIWADLGALFLVAFLLPTAVLMHPFWKETDEQMQQNEMAHFMKDTALAGAAVMLFAFFAHVEDLGLTITGPLFSLG